MNKDIRLTYDKLVRLYSASGLSPSSAKVFVWLIICEPAVQTGDDIRAATGVSAGGLSEAMSMLVKVGLVRRFRASGERKYQYEIIKDGFWESVKRRAEMVGVSRDIANEGLVVMPGNERLTAMRDSYGFFADTLPVLIDEYRRKHL